MAYLTPQQFKELSLLPPEYIEAVESASPEFVPGHILKISRWIDSRLRKRYKVPFPDGDKTPDTIQDWIVRILTKRVALRRGVDPVDQQFDELKNDHADALKEVLEAANSEVGLFDLPGEKGKESSGVARGGPFSYSEQSPYVAFDLQRSVASDEDLNGGGSYG